MLFYALIKQCTKCKNAYDMKGLENYVLFFHGREINPAFPEFARAGWLVSMITCKGINNP